MPDLAEPLHPAEPRDSQAPLLAGRAREQALLRAWLASALAGRGGLVLIGGEAGIGKTALAEELGREAARQGALALSGHCYDLTDTPPYGPWAELFAGWPDTPEPLPLPAGAPGAGPEGPMTSQAALFERVRDFLATAAARRPLALVLDDLHWADPASLDLLRYLARHLAALPLLLAVTYRADELTRRHPLFGLLPLLAHEARALRLDLRRLGDEAVRTLVRARYRLPVGDEDRLVAYLHARAEGNPFFTGELLRTLEAEDVLRRLDDEWALGELAGARVPPFLRQVIAGRLARLGTETQTLLAVAAVIGQEVPLALWAALGAAGEDALAEAVERGVETHLLEETPDGQSIRFVHALIREALYEGLPAPRRRAWHRRAGEALAARPAPDPDAVAYHFRQAGDDRAVEWLLRAAERAERAYAWVTAAGRYEGAVALMEAGGADARRRGWLLVHLAWLRRYADPRRSVAHLSAALALAAEVGDPVLAAVAGVFRGIFRCYAGDLREGLAELAAGVTAVDALTPTDREHYKPLDRFGSLIGGHNVRGTFVYLLALAGRYGEALAEWEREEARASAAPLIHHIGVSPTGDGYQGLGILHAALGRPEEAGLAFARARELYRVVDHHFLLGTNAALELTALALPYHADQLAERRRLADEAEHAWTLASGAWDDLLPALAHLPLMLLEGRWAEARGLALDAAAPGGIVNRRLFAAAALAPLAREQGDPELAWTQVRAALPAGPATAPGDIWFLVGLALQCTATALALDAGAPATARDWLAAHDRWLAWSGAVLGRAEGELAWATYYRAADDLAAARQHAEAALAHASEPRQPLALLAAHRTLGELATAAGRHAEAAKHLDAALALADACGALYERALTLLALAEMRHATGENDAATPLLAEARAICAPLGAAPALARAETLAGLLAAKAAAQPAYPGGLSAREVEVLRLVAAGLSNNEAAARLFLSPRTVEQHLRSIYNKLGIASRTAATRFAVEHGLA